jgi:hypothetical protein
MFHLNIRNNWQDKTASHARRPLSTESSCTYAENLFVILHTQNVASMQDDKKLNAKAVPLHTTEVLGGRGGIAPIHSRPCH